MTQPSHIDIGGIDKAALLAAFYNHARPFGMGMLHYRPQPMTVEQAREELATGDDQSVMFGQRRARLYFDYLHGRLLKIDITDDTLNPRRFDRDYGQGAAAKVVAELRRTLATQEATDAA